MEEKPTGGYKLTSSGDLFENKTQSIQWRQDVMYTYSVLDCSLKQDSGVPGSLVQLTMIVTGFG